MKRIFILLLISWLIICPASFAQWVQTNGPNGGIIKSLLLTETIFLAGTDGNGIYLSTNKGKSWSPANNGLTANTVNDLAVIGPNIFAGTNRGIFLSTDNGTNWSAVNNGQPANSIRCFVALGTNLYAGTSNGVFCSSNYGADWSELNEGLTNISIRTLLLSDTNLFAGTGNGIFLSTDRGVHWNFISSDISGDNQYIHSLAAGSNIDG
ncbi:MAG: WD40/YVTN/BNR-like repeat-containing protein, partial [Ignavibacteria bacterium]